VPLQPHTSVCGLKLLKLLVHETLSQMSRQHLLYMSAYTAYCYISGVRIHCYTLTAQADLKVEHCMRPYATQATSACDVELNEQADCMRR
jgi:hypothetical protein